MASKTSLNNSQPPPPQHPLAGELCPVQKCLQFLGGHFPISKARDRCGVCPWEGRGRSSLQITEVKLPELQKRLPTEPRFASCSGAKKGAALNAGGISLCLSGFLPPSAKFARGGIALLKPEGRRLFRVPSSICIANRLRRFATARYLLPGRSSSKGEASLCRTLAFPSHPPPKREDLCF